MVVYDATCSNLDDLENYIMMYSDPILWVFNFSID
jgi:hypothetical protein